MSNTSMIINYVPGEECRVAIVADGNLEEFHNERTDAISRVNNIYVGKVTNVEASIQAAFVDFGIGINGFLHVSDLHPRYFASTGDETTEKVGKKTPRKERPPIQHCLKRGQEVIVQVLKEGVGSKGPTLTSYLSIPGRFLVMMPQMDRVGVSRKVEDDDTRKRMRDILNQLDLPEGFGFILRTAGFDRTKTELKRDLAYLMRLWKDMEARRTKGPNKPRLLYSESDLLVRSLRDLVSSEIKQIIIDDDSAIARAVRFLKIVAPRSTAKVMRYTGNEPIFHAFGIEEQLALTHAREVPLPSGGRLVIDETEAVVAIDVNSGKSRAARDAETNAYKTNVEAVDVICRQLRLRDLGGIVINDMIDMRLQKHRKAIEALFRERLKKDRAKTTIAPISPFGILEMTRQRMRGSLSSQHYSPCPTCHGKGLIQKPSSVASQALRELALLLEADKVHRVELVVSARIAGELLSNRRPTINRLERQSNKQILVRVSETIDIDRFTLYAYDEHGADIDLNRLTQRSDPEKYLQPVDTKTTTVQDWALDPAEEIRRLETEEPPSHIEPIHDPFFDDQPDETPLADDQPGETTTKKRKRRRRRKRKSDTSPESHSSEHETPTATDEPAVPEATLDLSSGEQEQEEMPRKKRRRRRRRRKSSSTDEQTPAANQDQADLGTTQAASAAETAAETPALTNERAPEDQEQPGTTRTKKKRRRSKTTARRTIEPKPTNSNTDEPSIPSTSETSATAAASHAADTRASDTPAAKKKTRKKTSKAAKKTTKKTTKKTGTSAARKVGKKTGKKTSKTTAGSSNAKAGSIEAGTTGAARPAAASSAGTSAQQVKPRRTLYGKVRRRLSPSEIPANRDD